MGSVLLWLLLSIVEVHSQDVPYVSFMGNNLPNHSYIDLSQVGLTESNIVFCHTDLITCCSSYQGQHRGDWYSPDRRLPFSSSNTHIFQQRSNKKVEIKRRDGNDDSAVSGIYRCNIETNAVHREDASSISSEETVFIGLYESGGIYNMHYIKL